MTDLPLHDTYPHMYLLYCTSDESEEDDDMSDYVQEEDSEDESSVADSTYTPLASIAQPPSNI